MSDTQPIEITKCCETGLETASFSYYDGIHVVKEKQLKQTTNFSDVRNNNMFIVCCGDVMFKVEPTDYPTIQRRIF
jgi:hypothetical protein